VSCTTWVGLRWTARAGKHGIAREDALHAVAPAVYAESEFDEPRVPGHLRPTLYIGPPRRRDGPMVARAKHLRRMNREDGTDEH